MNQFILFALAVACIGSPALAQSPLDGVWKLEPDAKASSKLYDISLHDGVYACRSCRPTWSVPADGSFHPVTGQDFDEESVRVVDDRTVISRAGKGGAVSTKRSIPSPLTAISSAFPGQTSVARESQSPARVAGSERHPCHQAPMPSPDPGASCEQIQCPTTL